MSNGDRGTALIISAGGPNPPAASNTSIQFEAPASIVGFQGYFGGVPMGNEPQAGAGFTPPGSIILGGSYQLAQLWVIVALPTGDAITGTITANPALPFPVQIQSFAGGSYTLPAGQETGNFSLPFPQGSISEATAKSAPKGIV